jgi:pyruvate/2-oxoglutarate dehydrogenase complex dihydrolipoamide dehydrogenase (E3) component
MEADVVVIGLGPGGEKVAGDLAEAGLDVVGIEAELVGGECPYWGCIPSKMMVRAADLLAEGRRIPGMAGTSVVMSDWSPVARRIRDEATDTWNDTVAADRLQEKGGRLLRCRARVVGRDAVDVEGETVRVRRALVLATGQRPWVPPLLQSVPHWTNRDAIAAERVPSSLLVVGGGSIGLELGQVMGRFGAAVTIVEAGERLAMAEEPEASELIAEVLSREGVALHTGATIGTAEPWGDTGATIHLTDGRSLSGERMLVATGRRSDLSSLGVSALGLDEEADSIPVDGRMRVAPGVWAVGDVTGKGAFTHVAVYQARLCVADILGAAQPEADYRALPRVTFTEPEIGSVGLTETQARHEGGGDITVLHDSITASARGFIHRGEGFVKLVARDDVLVGATAMGPYGGEVFSLLALAVHAGITLETMRSMIFAYPTFHRAVDSALWSSPSSAAKMAGA